MTPDLEAAGKLAERLRADFDEWNNFSSEGLPNNAGDVLEAAATILALCDLVERSERQSIVEQCAKIAEGFPTAEQRQYLHGSQRGENFGAIMPTLQIVEAVVAQIVEGIRGLALPPSPVSGE